MTLVNIRCSVQTFKTLGAESPLPRPRPVLAARQTVCTPVILTWMTGSQDGHAWGTEVLSGKQGHQEADDSEVVLFAGLSGPQAWPLCHGGSGCQDTCDLSASQHWGHGPLVKPFLHGVLWRLRAWCSCRQTSVSLRALSQMSGDTAVCRLSRAHSVSHTVGVWKTTDMCSSPALEADGKSRMWEGGCLLGDLPGGFSCPLSAHRSSSIPWLVFLSLLVGPLVPFLSEILPSDTPCHLTIPSLYLLLQRWDPGKHDVEETL